MKNATISHSWAPPLPGPVREAARELAARTRAHVPEDEQRDIDFMGAVDED